MNVHKRKFERIRLSMEPYVPPYASFAEVYDEMMQNVDYVRWADYVDKLFAFYNYHPKRILDIACGTGTTDILLAEKGYRMSGSDIAFEMLAWAREKSKRKGIHLNLWQQDMRQLTVAKPFDAILCLYDSINYMATEDDMRKTFSKVYQALVPNGIFIFDVTTEYNIIKYFHRQTYAESYNDYSYIWKNLYLSREKLCKTVLTFFLKEDSSFFSKSLSKKPEDNYYKKYEEIHIQKIYSASQIKGLLEDTGYKLLSSFDAFTFNKYGKESERINFTAIKKE